MSVIATNTEISREYMITILVKSASYSRRLVIIAVGLPPTQFRASRAGLSCTGG